MNDLRNHAPVIFTLIAAAATGLVPACATDAPFDELADESDQDGETGKGDTADAFTYFTVTADQRACSIGAGCGGFFVARANRSTTICSNGVTSSRCYVDSINWSGTAMPPSVASAYETRIRNGEHLVLKGDLAPGSASSQEASLAASEIWVAGSPDGVDEGVFVMVEYSDSRRAVTETRLNSNRQVNIYSVELEASGATESAIQHANEQIYAGGIIVVGYRVTVFSGSKGRAANQFYTRAPVPAY